MQNEVDQARPGRRSRKYPIIRTLSVAVHRLRLVRRACSRYCFVSAPFAITVSTITVATTFLAVRYRAGLCPRSAAALQYAVACALSTNAPNSGSLKVPPSAQPSANCALAEPRCGKAKHTERRPRQLAS